MLAAPPSPVKLTAPPRRWLAGLLLVLLLLAGRPATAQVQEQRMGEILHADRTKTSAFAGKTFASSAAFGGKQAQVRAFPGERTAVLRRGGGAFETRAFAGSDTFRTRDFATKADRASGDGFAQRDRGFATKALPVREMPGADKSSALAREYVPGQKTGSFQGKRQDSIDEIRSQTNLSIDEVREILNKPNGRPGSKPAVSTLPVLRALPVGAPHAQ